MDKQYIAMCDTLEIQGQWEPKIGDRFYIDESEVADTHRDMIGLHIYDDEAEIFYKGYHSTYEIGWWLPRQEDWQNLLFASHYAPALPVKKKAMDFMVLNMHKEFIDFWESRIGMFEQPVEYWCALYMWIAHKKTWTEEGWR